MQYNSGQYFHGSMLQTFLLEYKFCKFGDFTFKILLHGRWKLTAKNIKVWKLVTYQRKDFSIIICLFIFLVLLLYYLCSIVGVNPKHNISEVFSWNLLIDQWCEPWYIWIIQTNDFLVQRTLHTKSGRILQIICVQQENWEVYGLNWTCLSFVWWLWGSVRKRSLILFWWVTLFHVFWDAPTFGFMIILSEFLTTLSQY